MEFVEQLVVCPEETGQLFLKISVKSSQIIPHLIDGDMICGSRFQQPGNNSPLNGRWRAGQFNFGKGLSRVESQVLISKARRCDMFAMLMLGKAFGVARWSSAARFKIEMKHTHYMSC